MHTVRIVYAVCMVYNGKIATPIFFLAHAVFEYKKIKKQLFEIDVYMIYDSKIRMPIFFLAHSVFEHKKIEEQLF